jgi:hypothetical protein
MFIKCSVEQSLSVGDVVQYDTVQEKWLALTSSTAMPWGVVVSTPTADETEGSSLYLARVQFAGSCLAKASRDVPAQGGCLSVEVGGVYVNLEGDCGLIAPASYSQSPRLANDLVLVHIR